MSEEEALSVDKAKRKVDMKEEYYVSFSLMFCLSCANYLRL